MPIVQKSPNLRFEFCYGDTVTVLEGAELGRLNSRFIWHFRRELKRDSDTMSAFLISVVHTYDGLYGNDIVSENELRDLSTADARKMDLFYRGMYLLLCKTLYPENDWEALLYRKTSFMEFLTEVVLLKPNVFGVGIDFNAIIRRAFSTKQRQ